MRNFLKLFIPVAKIDQEVLLAGSKKKILNIFYEVHSKEVAKGNEDAKGWVGVCDDLIASTYILQAMYFYSGTLRNPVW